MKQEVMIIKEQDMETLMLRLKSILEECNMREQMVNGKWSLVNSKW